MAERTDNRVRKHREARALSQIMLAERAGLTRQSVGAIEAGRATPAVDVALRIARALDCRVEDLFGTEEDDPALRVELISDRTSSRVALAHVREHWIGVPLGSDELRTAADALVVKARGRLATVSPLRPLSESRNNLALMGCAVGLGLLADRLQIHQGSGRYLWVSSSSGAALHALANGLTHVAGVHSVSDPDADANVEAVRRAGVRESVVLVTLARWEAGLLTRNDDERVRGVADLGTAGVRLVAREKGAGARQLLEQRLRAAGESVNLVRAAPVIASGHVDVARAIAMSAADVGVATRDAALAFGLRFLPLAEERYDLVVPQSLVTDPRIERLLDVLVSRAGRRDLESLGYDVSSAGNRVAEVKAA